MRGSPAPRLAIIQHLFSTHNRPVLISSAPQIALPRDVCDNPRTANDTSLWLQPSVSADESLPAYGEALPSEMRVVSVIYDCRLGLLLSIAENELALT